MSPTWQISPSSQQEDDGASICRIATWRVPKNAKARWPPPPPLSGLPVRVGLRLPRLGGDVREVIGERQKKKVGRHATGHVYRGVHSKSQCRCAGEKGPWRIDTQESGEIAIQSHISFKHYFSHVLLMQNFCLNKVLQSSFPFLLFPVSCKYM